MKMLRIPTIIGGALLVGFLAQVGAETIFDDTPVPPVGAPGGPRVELSADDLESFKRGRLLFDRDWHQADGLGTPEINADSCRGCHEDPAIGGAGGLDLNVFRYGFDDNGNGPFENLPGGQVASKMRAPSVPGRDEIDPTSDVFEQRQTPSVFGGGLIDTIFQEEILANEDPDDEDGDGIRGVARMHDVAGVLEVGRFGWKAQIPTLRDFLRDALGGETGITVPDDGRGFGMLTDDDTVADPEISEDELDDLDMFASNLSAPQRRNADAPSVLIGEGLFDTVGCANCHIPSLEGSEGPVFLYSDLLLHNIMPDDFRGMAETDAGVGVFQTPPLWGISRTAPYLHDGRATTLTDAIMNHDGEAALVRAEFEALSATDKVALIRFLESL